MTTRRAFRRRPLTLLLLLLDVVDVASADDDEGGKAHPPPSPASFFSFDSMAFFRSPRGYIGLVLDSPSISTRRAERRRRRDVRGRADPPFASEPLATVTLRNVVVAPPSLLFSSDYPAAIQEDDDDDDDDDMTFRTLDDCC
mmetsp:Transcript_40445/g.121864  ORF Transcript_40445/g.121864 Transcript_40445/m.121864 type:complete len:142 (+) Transcript_40445:748-1173(+)